MAKSKVSRKCRRRPDSERVRAVQDGFYHRGESVRQWAKKRGYSPPTVYAILRGERACTRGVSHKIAVELGLKDGAHAANDADSAAPQQFLITTGE